TSPSAPIVLVARRSGGVADGVAPGLADLGVMLAYSPLHHQLFDRLGRKVFLTEAGERLLEYARKMSIFRFSGNISAVR
ncbi:MAG: Sua5/YciO/YrdC/YwlC family protein, partial [Bacteroidia bacterium]|nr:Sua5/YciO/YrdC/YwlC family protein [Bacteroidia bacterium]